MLSKLLKERNIPPLKSKEEMLYIMQKEVYGFLPEAPEGLRFEESDFFVSDSLLKKAVCKKVVASGTIKGRPFSFPFYATFPIDKKSAPFFVHINFRSDVDDKYQPIEYLIDSGFAVLSFNHKEVSSDDDNMTDGFSGVLYPDGTRSPEDAGKIAMWAWAAHRVMDYAQTKDELLDLTRGAVCGHSRLGKTALLAAATDPRFYLGYSNDSGCSGAAITRKKQGETVRPICEKFPYWFCENYQKYMDKEDEMPFDQHYLVASIAPRKVVIGSASNDQWADPISEQLCCVASSDAFEKGFVGDTPAEIDEEFFEGDIGYHLREGRHIFSPEDWKKLIKYINLHS